MIWIMKSDSLRLMNVRNKYHVCINGWYSDSYTGWHNKVKDAMLPYN